MHCTVKEGYTKYYPDPIKVNAGDKVIPGKEDDEFPGWIWATSVKDNKAGWMPKRMIKEDGGEFISTSDYNAMELTVNAGERLKILETESGWHLCETTEGETGWVPGKNVRVD